MPSRKLLYVVSWVFVISLFSQKAGATGDSLSVLTKNDTIFIQRDSLGVIYFYHRVMPKQTMYSLCRFYGIKQSQLMTLNPVLKVRGIQIDELIRVPISARLIRVESEPKKRENFAPVVYEVSPGEGLYSVSRNYFGIKPEKLMQINGMSAPDLKLGQILLLGWIPLDVFNKINENVVAGKGRPKSGTKADNAKTDTKKPGPNALGTTSTAKEREIAKEAVQDAVEKTTSEEAKSTPASNREKFESYEGTKAFEQGLAFWHKELKGSNGLFVLHRTAPRGSIIKITNPMFNSTVYAKVVGTVSPNSYSDDVMMVVSPEVAIKLGARDARFFAKIAYIKG